MLVCIRPRAPSLQLKLAADDRFLNIVTYYDSGRLPREWQYRQKSHMILFCDSFVAM
uniref:Uncharacterized protein n=1 Tax=Arundo donax TaxID=35708 RepID=A0A0A8XUB1_ARUDO